MNLSIFRKCIFSCFILLTHKFYAGTFDIGLMAGVNAALNNFQINQTIKNYDSKLGYNANAYVRFGFSKFIIQPEIGYLSNRASFTFLENNQPVDANLNLGQVFGTTLFGFKLGNIRIMTGPIFTYTANQSSDQITSTQSFINMIENGKNISWGGVFNLGVNITKKWSVDARVSRMLTTSDFNIKTQNVNSIFEGNTGMVSLSLGYSIFRLK